MDAVRPKPIEILVVDDDSQWAGFLGKVLHVNVSIAATIEMAEAHLGEHSYDVVIVDGKLPDGNGGDLVQTIRSTHNSFATDRVVPIVLFTSYSEEEFPSAVLREVEFRRKPIAFSTLLEILNRLLKLSESHFRNRWLFHRVTASDRDK